MDEEDGKRRKLRKGWLEAVKEDLRVLGIELWMEARKKEGNWAKDKKNGSQTAQVLLYINDNNLSII